MFMVNRHMLPWRRQRRQPELESPCLTADGPTEIICIRIISPLDGLSGTRGKSGTARCCGAKTMYVRPRTLDEAVQALAAPGVQILAGGTDFYPAHVGRVVSAPVLDITAIDELDGIAETAGEFRIGGRTTWTQLIATPLPRCFDALKAAAREVGSIQIQNRATIAGNLCNASPAADGVPPLLTLDATLELQASGTRRLVPLTDFITGYRKTLLQPGELVTAIHVPRRLAEGRASFLKLGSRRFLVISI